MTENKFYPEVEPNPNFAAIEERILKFWAEEKIFEKSVENRPNKTADGKNNEFIFYDGPPFANGLPHYGHLLTGFVKDLFARFQTMKGMRVERRFGWDCHGLPAEMGVEKELNISGRQQITKYGIDKFNDACQTSVMKYAHEWEYYVTRQGRWVDFKNDYKTMDKSFMESVMWALKQLYDKGWMYEAYRVVPYSWAAETPLSNFETQLDNSYRMRQDPAVTVAFELDKRELQKAFQNADISKMKFCVLAWTTTPWTLPSNLALAVGPDMQYEFRKFSKGDNEYHLASVKYFEDKYDLYPEVLETLPKRRAHLENTPSEESLKQTGWYGEDLVDLTYQPLFPYFKNHPNAFKVLAGDFIEEGTGTGVVHMAPGFGEDDQKVCEANGISIVVPVDGSGKFTDEIFDIGWQPLPADARNVKLESERLYLRPFEEKDWADFLAMLRDPEVAKTTAEGVIAEDILRAEFDRFIADDKKYGFSQWAAIEKNTGKFVGRAGLDNRDFAQFADKSLGKVSEIRYCFKSDFWGRGFAKELTPIILNWAFNELKLDAIQAGNKPDYQRSIKLLERFGFEYQSTENYKVGPVHYRVLKKENYKAAPLADKKIFSLKGMNVFEANKPILQRLKDEKKLIKQETIDHNYPHCWRTDQPLIYRAVPSWYVQVTAFRHRMVELNKQINWIPGHVKEGLFGKWIENARDWSISRNRFWGAPIPIWKSDNPENKNLYVFGSIAELEDFFGQKVENLHRPYIDNLTKPDPENPKFTLRRVEDVLDCWFESGSMPYGQVHYPFENKDWFESGHFPADFIVEYQAQTRGWFYTLMVLSTALFDKPPFLNCICHGVVLDDKGQKLSKRLNNYADPKWLFDTYGADALRWFMMSSPVMRGSEMYIDKEGKFIRDSVRLYIKPIWNAYSFFVLYANADELKAEYSFDSQNIMDRYILTKLHQVVTAVDAALQKYDTVAACQAIADFFEVLNNWYIRRNKERFWKDEQDADKQTAYNTLYTVLHAMCRVAAPLLPMVTEEIFKGLTGNAKELSVHLEDYPTDVLAKVKPDSKLEAEMDLVRDICNSAHSIRNTQNIRVRQPLSSITVAGVRVNKDFASLVTDELNVKEFKELAGGELAKFASFKLQLNMKKLGAKLGQQFKEVLAASKNGNWKKLEGGLVEVGGVKLEVDEFDLKLVPNDEKTSAALSNSDAVVILDTNITPELEKEGIARDLVRMIQQARKDSNLNVSDRITLGIKAPDNVVHAFREHKDYISAQTLTAKIEEATDNKFDFRYENDFDGEMIVISLSKAA